MKLLTLVFALLSTAFSPIFAQQPPPPAPSPSPAPGEGRVAPSANGAYWRCTLPGGVFLVPLRTISSLSSHEFVVDGAARVTEVNVATDSSVLARFYYLEPVDISTPMGLGQSAITALQDKLKEGADRSGQAELWKKVIKNYPGSTHAHTVEYRLDSKQDLLDLFESVEKAWLENRSRQFKRPADISKDPQ